jgi:predicted transposase YbfD/YdcC
MPSSPIPAARRQPLLDLLSQIPDQRKERGRRHPLTGLLAVGIAAVTAGARSFAAIGQWAADAGPDVLAALGATRGAADESTCRRTFAQVSADTLDGVLGAWLWTRAARIGGRMVIAVDGKAVRGAKGRDGKAPHLVAALAHGIGAVLGQVAVDSKSNEIPAVRELLKAFADLTGAVLTMDALHTQHDTAQAVLGRGADYVMTVKANMPTLHAHLKKLPWKDVPSFSCVTKDRGRRARRTVKALLAPAWTDFEGAAQVAQVRRTVTRKGKKTVEVVYVITSDADADPATPPSPPGSRGTGTSRTSSTGSATSPTRKTSPWSGQGTPPGSWPRSAAWPSASCAWTATRTSPPPTATTPATRSAP